MLPLWTLLRLLYQYHIFKASHCNSFIDQAPLGFIKRAWGCFTNVSRGLQNNLAKIHNTRNHIYGENFKLKLCTCAQSIVLGIQFQLEILITRTISAMHKFLEHILESSRNVSETTPDLQMNYLRVPDLQISCRDMMTSSNGNIFCVTGLCVGISLVTSEFPSQRPVTRNFDVFFDLRLNKLSRCQWFDMPLCSLWCPCNDLTKWQGHWMVVPAVAAR